MEHTDELHPATTETAPRCAHCATHLFHPPAGTPLCPDCREQFVRYPFPAWVKAFGAVILLFLLGSLYSVPASIGAGIHYQRGRMAAQKHNFVTAQRELQTVVKKQPSFTNAGCRLAIAAFYNNDLAALSQTLKNIEGKHIDDNQLYAELNNVMEAADSYFPSDSFSVFSGRHGSPATDTSLSDYYAYLTRNPRDAYARAQLADMLYDRHAYKTCDSLLDIALQQDPAYLYALSLKMPLKREMGQLDSSLFYVHRTLAINHEYTYAYASGVKALLRQKKDKEALQWAKKGYAIDEKDAYSMATLALAYHFNNDPKHRDALMAKAAGDSAGTAAMDVVKNIVSGKEKFRD